MNASHSPILNIADIQPAAGLRSGGLQLDGAGESFDAVFDNERASQSTENPNKGLNNNKLKGGTAAGAATTDTATETPDTLNNNEGELQLEVATDKPTRNPKPELAADELKSDEQTDGDPLLSGTALTQPIADEAIARGEQLPPGGKNLPAHATSSMKESGSNGLTSAPDALEQLDESDAQLQRSLTRTSAQEIDNRYLQKMDTNLLKQDRFNKSVAADPEYFAIEDGMKLNSGKNSAESILESLALATTSTPKELVTAPNPGNPILTAAIAATNSDVQLIQTPTVSATAAENAQASLNVRGNSTDWSQAIGDKIRWMQNASVSTAELHLNPAELGSIEIKIVTEDQQARVSFITSSSVAQEMIEESLSKLKELLADHGIALDQSDISQQDNQNASAQEDEGTDANSSAKEKQFEHETTLATRSPVTSRIGQVDHYV